MVFVAYAGPVRPAAALRHSVLCLPTDIHSLFVNELSSSSLRWLRINLLFLLQRYVRACCAYRPTFIRCLSINPPPPPPPPPPSRDTGGGEEEILFTAYNK